MIEGRAIYDGIDFTPPQSVRDEAAKALAWRREFGRGGTAVGIARARDLSNGVKISPETARRMKAYFDRHEVDKKGEGFSPGEPGFPSNGRIAWGLWGSDAGWAWSRKLVRQMEARDEASKRGRSMKGDNDIGDDDTAVDMAEQLLRAFDESKHPRDDDGKFAGSADSDDATHAKDLANHVKKTAKALDKATKAKKAAKWSLNPLKKKKANEDFKKAYSDHLDAVAMNEDWKELNRSHSMKIERRSILNAEVAFPAIRVEHRNEETVVDGRPQVTRREWCVGYASVFGILSLELGDFVERIDPKAFDRVLSRHRDGGVAPRALWNHDANYPLARYPDTLTLSVDERGLRYEFPFPRTTYGQDLRALIEDGIVKGSSFGFTVAPGGERWSKEDGRSIRTVTEIADLYDVSPTTFPAYPDSDVAVALRSYDRFRRGASQPSAAMVRSRRRAAEYEEFLRQHGRKIG